MHKIKVQNIFRLEQKKEYYSEILTTQTKELLEILNVNNHNNSAEIFAKIAFDLKQLKNILLRENELNKNTKETIGINLFPETILYLFGFIDKNGEILKEPVINYENNIIYEIEKKINKKLIIEILENGGNLYGIINYKNISIYKKIFKILSVNNINVFIDDLGSDNHKLKLLEVLLLKFGDFISGIKIDVQKTKDIIKNKSSFENKYFVNFIINYLKKYRKNKLVIEGIETEEELKEIKSIFKGIESNRILIQGYLFDKGNIF